MRKNGRINLNVKGIRVATRLLKINTKKTIIIKLYR